MVTKRSDYCQERATQLEEALVEAEAMSTPSEEIKQRVADCRDALHLALVASHGGDRDAALDDDRFDALFERVGVIFKKREEPRARKRNNLRGKYSESGLYIARR